MHIICIACILLFPFFTHTMMEEPDVSTTMYTCTQSVPYSASLSHELITAYAATKSTLFSLHQTASLSAFDTNTCIKTKTINNIPQTFTWTCKGLRCPVCDEDLHLAERSNPTVATYHEPSNLLIAAKQRGHTFSLAGYKVKGSHAKNCSLARALTVYKGHTEMISDLSLMQDGLATISWDKTIKVWNVSTAQCKSTLDITQPGHCLLPLSPHTIITVQGWLFDDTLYSLYMWDTRTNQSTQLCTIGLPLTRKLARLNDDSFFFAQSTRTLFDTQSTLDLWDMRVQKPINCLAIPSDKNGKHQTIKNLIWCGNHLIASTDCSSLYGWDIASHEQFIIKQEESSKKNSLISLNEDSFSMLTNDRLYKYIKK